jgi:hypothetical protein
MTFHFQRLMLGATIILLPLLSNLSASAQTKSRTIDLKINPEYQQKQSCPNTVRIIETPQPWQDGGFATDGYATNLNSIVSNLTVGASNESKVTWVGKLKPKYVKCSGSASSEKFKIRFVKGNAYFTLNLAGKRDPNNLSLVVGEKGVKNGNPTWTWGGSD